MAFKLTKLEKVLATAVGLDIARPGTSRAAFTRAAQEAVATLPIFGAIVKVCVISSPTCGDPLTDSNLSAFTEEYVLSV